MVRRAFGLGVGAAAVVTLLAGCDVGRAFGGFGWPSGITAQANQMYDLWIGSVIAALAVGFFVWGLIFWCIVKYRKKTDELPPQTRFNLPIEIIYTVVPFLIVAVLFYYTAVIQTDVNRQSANPDVTVEVVAFQWNWQFNYKEGPSDDGSAATIASELGTSDYIPVLVVPTGRTVRLEQVSRDVIHSFWVPDLLFKRDQFPDPRLRNSFEITVNKEGSYVGRCAELCGTYHSMMNFELRAVSPEKYDQFIAERQAGKSTPEALAAIGETPYAETTSPFPTKRI
ncbi:MAG: cytochrome c oxidase subunit II [Micromonosporaceae bacterium]